MHLAPFYARKKLSPRRQAIRKIVHGPEIVSVSLLKRLSPQFIPNHQKTFSKHIEAGCPIDRRRGHVAGRGFVLFLSPDE
jgi:hypothetical protein